MKKILISLAIAIAFLAGNSVQTYVQAADNVCFCHNVNNNPHTICTDDAGLINGHTDHVNNGTDTMGECPAEPTPTTAPTVTPTPTTEPTSTPTPTPTNTPTTTPTKTPSPTKTPTPTRKPSKTPTPSPTRKPTPTKYQIPPFSCSIFDDKYSPRITGYMNFFR